MVYNPSLFYLLMIYFVLCPLHQKLFIIISLNHRNRNTRLRSLSKVTANGEAQLETSTPPFLAGSTEVSSFVEAALGENIHTLLNFISWVPAQHGLGCTLEPPGDSLKCVMPGSHPRYSGLTAQEQSLGNKTSRSPSPAWF